MSITHDKNQNPFLHLLISFISARFGPPNFVNER